MRIVPVFFTMMMIFLAGCAHVISEENRKSANTSITFEELKENPGKYTGSALMLGGAIAGVKNTQEGGQIEVIQYRLTDDGYPDEVQGSAGRFLATSPAHLDAELYPEGDLITVFGEAKGSRSPEADDAKAAYPVISIREAHVWLPEEKDKRPFHIPGTNLVDPYYHGIDAPQPNRYNGTVIPPLTGK